MRFGTFLLAAAVASVTLPVADHQLFWAAEPLELKLQAPLQKLFAGTKTDEHFKVPATLTYVDAGRRTVSIAGVEISVRGNTSRRETECTFPKLKLDLDH